MLLSKKDDREYQQRVTGAILAKGFQTQKYNLMRRIIEASESRTHEEECEAASRRFPLIRGWFTRLPAFDGLPALGSLAIIFSGREKSGSEETIHRPA